MRVLLAWKKTEHDTGSCSQSFAESTCAVARILFFSHVFTRSVFRELHHSREKSETPSRLIGKIAVDQDGARTNPGRSSDTQWL